MRYALRLALLASLIPSASTFAQAPAPVLVKSGLPLTIPPDEISPPNLPIFGPPLRISPAHRLAMLEANRSLAANDPLVANAAERLERMTAQYVDDAPRIVELSTRLVKDVRASKRPASPYELLDGALAWKAPARPGQNYPRPFVVYMSIYRRLRVDEKKDHKDALDIMQGRKPDHR